MIIVDLRIDETLQTGGLGKRNYRSTFWEVLFPTAPTGPDKSPMNRDRRDRNRGAKVSIYF